VLGGLLFAGHAFAESREPADHTVVPSGPTGPRTDDPTRSVEPTTTTSEDPTTTTTVEQPKEIGRTIPPVHSTPGVTPGVNVIITPQPLPTERVVPRPTQTIHEPPPVVVSTPTTIKQTEKPSTPTTSTTMPKETQPTTTSTTCPTPTRPIG
jgi:hypothetical protein